MTSFQESNLKKLPKRVVIITYNIHNMGGVPKSTSNIANGLIDRGYAVDIVSICPGSVPMEHGIDSRINISVCNSKIPTAQTALTSNKGRKLRSIAVRLFSRWKPSRLRFVRPTVDGVSKLRTILSQVNGDETILLVTDVNSMDYVTLAYKESNLVKPAIIGQFKGSVGALSQSRFKRVLRTYSEIDLILALTPDDADLLQSHTPVEVDWITNPIPVAPDFESGSRLKRVISMGRLAPEKGFSEALKAWKTVVTECPGWQLVIFGEGPLRLDLEREILSLGIQNSVYLAGKTDDPLKELSLSHALLLPSKHEGFGMVIAEAASVGTCTVAFDCSPGVRLQIESGVNGILVPPGDVEAFSRAIVDLLQTGKGAFLGQNAKRSVARFGVDETLEKWDMLMFKAINNRHTV